jgi:hypothetical protein
MQPTTAVDRFGSGSAPSWRSKHRSPASGVLQADFLFVKPDLFDALCAQAGFGG